jgi:hypothetical protein
VPHVTFIHGIGNKVEPGLLERAWVDSLRDNGGPDLWSEHVTTSMCYWADVLYATPLPAMAGSTEAGEEAEVMAAEDIGQTWYEELPAAEKEEVRELAAEVGAITWLTDLDNAVEVGGGADPATGAADGAVAGLEPSGPIAPAEVADEFERIPLPGPLKKRLMRAFLRDVHHYLWDVDYSPRPGDTFRVRRDVRRRALDALAAAERAPRPHVVVGHSLGSVIAYDVLKNVDGAPVCDGLVTLGSPLGLDEVQDRLDPGWSRWDGFPAVKLGGSWVNVFDRLDPVCGFDPVLANDFRRGGQPVVTDVDEPNWGTWRHSIGKYFRGSRLRKSLVDLLGIA